MNHLLENLKTERTGRRYLGKSRLQSIFAMMENTLEHVDLVGRKYIYVRDILEYSLSLEVK
ncbi:MAG: hypothetical protein GY810_32310 [Aureispira sp.]|nr:hypothetical protein [Aureispira sp.]